MASWTSIVNEYDAAGLLITQTTYNNNGTFVVVNGDAANEIYADQGGQTWRAGGGNDKLYGSTGSDFLYGDAGNDRLEGNEGDDRLAGGAGADTLIGDSGFDYASYEDSTAALVARLDLPNLNTGFAAGDTYSGIEGLVGGAGNDTLCGDGGANHILGGGGDDLLYGQDGNDTLEGGDGNDHIFGGVGADVLIGGAGFDLARYDDSPIGILVRLDQPSLNTGIAAGDTYIGIEGLAGGAGNDELWGDDGTNNLHGHGGNDVLYGKDGIDNLFGNEGDDVLDGGDGEDYLRGGLGADVLIGGNGKDYAVYDDTPDGVIARLDLPQLNTGFAAGDTYIGIEGLYGGSWSDTLVGDSSANQLMGQGAADFLYGQDGADSLDGGEGDDHLFGGAGADILLACCRFRGHRPKLIWPCFRTRPG